MLLVRIQRSQFLFPQRLLEQLDEVVAKVNLTSTNQCNPERKELMHVVHAVAVAVVELSQDYGKYAR